MITTQITVDMAHIKWVWLKSKWVWPKLGTPCYYWFIFSGAPCYALGLIVLSHAHEIHCSHTCFFVADTKGLHTGYKQGPANNMAATKNEPSTCSLFGSKFCTWSHPPSVHGRLYHAVSWGYWSPWLEDKPMKIIRWDRYPQVSGWKQQTSA